MRFNCLPFFPFFGGAFVGHMWCGSLPCCVESEVINDGDVCGFSFRCDFSFGHCEGVIFYRFSHNCDSVGIDLEKLLGRHVSEWVQFFFEYKGRFTRRKVVWGPLSLLMLYMWRVADTRTMVPGRRPSSRGQAGVSSSLMSQMSYWMSLSRNKWKVSTSGKIIFSQGCLLTNWSHQTSDRCHNVYQSAIELHRTIFGYSISTNVSSGTYKVSKGNTRLIQGKCCIIYYQTVQ